MVSIHSLRPIHTFLYTIINGNVIATFVQKNKRFEILWSKETFFLRTYATLKPPPPSYAIVRIWLDPPSIRPHVFFGTGPVTSTENLKS